MDRPASEKPDETPGGRTRFCASHVRPLAGHDLPIARPYTLAPDEDCSNYAERAVDLSQMDELFMSVTDTEIRFDENGAREHGFSEKSIALAREMAA